MDVINIGKLILEFSLPKYIIRIFLGNQVHDFNIDQFLEIDRTKPFIEEIIRSGIAIFHVFKGPTINDSKRDRSDLSLENLLLDKKYVFKSRGNYQAYNEFIQYLHHINN
jgi:hypothetical protein